MEPLKEAVEVWLQRVKAPILGYTVLACVAINWKALWALLFSEIDVFSRFFYFDLRTDVYTLLVYPVTLGLLSTFLSPWIGLMGLLIVRKPSRLQRKFQQDALVEQEVYQLLSRAKIEDAKAEDERARESRKLAALKRIQEAEEIGSEAVEALEQDRISSTTSENDPKIVLSDLDNFAIRLVGAVGDAYVEDLSKKDEVLSHYRKIVPRGTPKRLNTELTDTLRRIEKLGLAKREAHGAWSLTSRGYNELDRLSKSP